MSVQPTSAAAANPYPNDYDDFPASPLAPPVVPLFAPAALPPVPSLITPSLVRSLLPPPAPAPRGLKRTFEVVEGESDEDLYKRARLVYEKTIKSDSARTPSPVPLPLSSQPTNPLLPDPVGFVRRETEPTLSNDAATAREARIRSLDEDISDIPSMLKCAKNTSVKNSYDVTYDKGDLLRSEKYCDVFSIENNANFVLVHPHKNAILENLPDIENFWINVQSNYEELLKAGVPLAKIENIKTLGTDLFAIRENVKPIKELDPKLIADLNSPINQEIKDAAIRCYGADPSLNLKAENMYFVETAEGPKLRLIFEL